MNLDNIDEDVLYKIQNQRFDVVDIIEYRSKLRFIFVKDEHMFKRQSVPVNCIDVMDGAIQLCEGYGTASEYSLNGFEQEVSTIRRGLRRIHTRYYGTIEELHRVADEERRPVTQYL